MANVAECEWIVLVLRRDGSSFAYGHTDAMEAKKHYDVEFDNASNVRESARAAFLINTKQRMEVSYFVDYETKRSPVVQHKYAATVFDGRLNSVKLINYIIAWGQKNDTFLVPAVKCQHYGKEYFILEVRNNAGEIVGWIRDFEALI